MDLRRVLIGSTLLPLLAACGGSSPFTVNGTIRGSSLKSGDAVSGVGAVSVFGITMTGAVVALSSSSGLCALAAAGKDLKSSQYMIFVLSDRATNSAPTVAGTHTIWPGTGAQPAKLAVAVYAQTDANCNRVQNAVAVSGTITITSISNGDVSGNFDFTFDSGDHVTGSFSSKNCSALISALGNSTCS